MGKGKSKKTQKHANKSSGAIKLGKMRKEAERGSGMPVNIRTPHTHFVNKPTHSKASHAYEEEILKLAERNHIHMRGVKTKQEFPGYQIAPATFVLPPSVSSTPAPFEHIDALIGEKDAKLIQPAAINVKTTSGFSNPFSALDEDEDEEVNVMSIQPATFVFPAQR